MESYPFTNATILPEGGFGLGSPLDAGFELDIPENFQPFSY
jgi:hypothetical protein